MLIIGWIDEDGVRHEVTRATDVTASELEERMRELWRTINGDEDAE